MLRSNNKPKSSAQAGFTIIEVLIVLAIAGLIMLIVFLAVPALQRNARNTQMKSSASSILGAVNEFENNNNGQLPTGVSPVGSDGTVTFTGPAGSNDAPSSTKIQPGYAVSLNVNNANTMPTATATFIVQTNSKCNGNVFGSTTPRAIAIGFLIETGGSNTAPQCIDG